MGIRNIYSTSAMDAKFRPFCMAFHSGSQGDMKTSVGVLILENLRVIIFCGTGAVCPGALTSTQVFLLLKLRYTRS